MLTTDKTVLFCIGAQKAGTTWLNANLSMHVECHMPVKEVHYFDAVSSIERAKVVLRRYRRKLQEAEQRMVVEPSIKRAQNKIDAMRSHLALLELCGTNSADDSDYISFLHKGSGSKALLGDITPNYSPLSREEFARMAVLSPNSRFLFIMRDPIDRLWSEMRMSAEMKGKNLPGGKGASIEAEFAKRCFKKLDSTMQEEKPSKPSLSNYMLTMQELEAVIPRDKILTIFFEDLFEQSSFKKICSFLGIAPVPAQTETVKFPGRKLSLPKERFLDVYKVLSKQYEWATERYGDKLPKRWRDQMKVGES